MTEEEFKEQAVPIYRAGPSDEGVRSMQQLMRQANQTIPVNRLAVLAAEALDEAYPQVQAMLSLMGQPNAKARMEALVEEGKLKGRLDPPERLN